MKALSKRTSQSTVIAIVFTIAAICMLLLSTGCQATDESRESSSGAAQTQTKVEEIQARGVLKVGTAGDYQPMSYLDPQAGRYVGFDAELAEDLASSLGVDIEYVETSWPTLMDDTLAGKFDLAICGITVTDARKEQALMSDGYLGNGKTVLCRAEDASKYTSLALTSNSPAKTCRMRP